MAAILRLTIAADMKGYCPIGHLRTSVISDVGLIGHPSSMLWSIDTCQNKVSADQYHVTLLRAQVECWSRSAVFFKLTADRVLVSNWIAGSSPAKTRLDGVSTSSSKHLYSSLRSTLLVFRWNTVLEKPFSFIFGGFNRKQVGHYSLRVCERKDRVVWQGFNHAGAVIGRCCVFNWTVLPLKILNWSSFLGRDGK